MIDPIYIIYLFPFIFIFGYFFYINRQRKWPKNFLKPNKLTFSLDLTAKLRREAGKKIHLLTFMPSLSILLVYVLILTSVVLGLDLHTKELPPRLTQALTFFGITLFLIFMFLSFILYKMNKANIARYKGALEASLKNDLRFEIANGKIKVPTLLLANPSFFRAAELNLSHLEIPLESIISFEIFDGEKNNYAQYKILTDGEIAKFGYGQLGDSAFFEFGICIRRKHFLTQEYDIVCLLNELLSEKLIVRADISGPKQSVISKI